MLTGATGFLGTHILGSLLRDTEVEVYCLIRAATEEAAMKRVQDSMQIYGMWEEMEAMGVEERIVPVLGNLSMPLLGLSNSDFQMLAGELDAIIHNGASVNLVRSYRSLKPVNVLGTQEVLRLAVTNAFGTRVKPVHFVSTNGVFPFNSVDKTFLERADLSNTWKDLNDGYAQSKWVAERMCMDAQKRGLPVSILRPGNMAPSSVTGIWNRSDFIYILLQGCLEVGCVPDNSTWKADMTPVDFAARAMVHIAVEHPVKGLGKVVHIQNPGEMRPFQDMVSWVRESTGLGLEGMPFDEFRDRVCSLVEAQEGEPGPISNGGVLKKLEAGLESFDYYLSDPGHLDCFNLEVLLLNSGICCPSLDKKLISTYAATLELPSKSVVRAAN
ncbi:unnamed protein product [Choristocarpus tenellus]